MKKLEDIPKSNGFEAPEGYFDRLPGIIQARVTKEQLEPAGMPFLRYGLRIAVPILAIVAAAFFYRYDTRAQSAEELIASIDSAALAAYLGETDLSADDLLETITLDANELQAIQEGSMKEIILNDAAMDSLTNEFGADYF